jgi:hypothetical protein
MAKSKDAADVTETPKGLDVAVTMPGTIVGSHDLQGTDGTERTDRPGEILGTPIVDDAERATANREREAKRSDYVTSEVDRANREELPKLGGPVDDGWEPGESKGTKSAATKAAEATPTLARATVTPVRTTEMAAPKAAPATPAKSGITVKSGIER